MNPIDAPIIIIVSWVRPLGVVVGVGDTVGVGVGCVVGVAVG